MKPCAPIRRITPAGKPLAWGAILLLILARPAAATEQVTIQISATNPQLRAADTFLDQAAPNTVNGAQQTLAIRSLTGNSNRRAIVMFDLSSLPNVGIKSAILTLHVQTPPSATRTYEAHAVTSFFTEGSASWNTRVAGIPWGAAGGDFTAAPTATATVTNASTTVTFDITADVQTWYNGSTNYGTLIKDRAENNAAGVQTVFWSKEAPTQTNAPSLTVTFVQNVASLSTTPGNATNALNWTYPAALGTVIRPTTGVVILRRQNSPVDKFSWPADGSNPAVCSTLTNGKVVFKTSTLGTTFTDNFSCPGDPAPNDTTWFYKVFLHDSVNNYTTNGTSPANGASTYTLEISATPSATAANLQHSLWIAATHSTNLAAPSLFPASVVMVESQSNLLFGFDGNTGLRRYPPVSIAGSITSRSALIDAAETTVGKNVIFVGDQAGLVYAVATDTGQILWVVNPTGLTSNIFFQGGAAVQLKSLSGATYLLPHDLVVVGTRIGTTTTANKIFGLDANTGATQWTVTGGSGGVPSMDIINSTAEIDYFNGALWLTSHSNGNTQPSLWKIDPNTGLVINTSNLDDIDSSPSLAPGNDVLFVGNNAGTLFAVNTTSLATTSFNGGDGAIVGFPVVLGSSSPYTVIFSGATHVHAVTYTVATGTFAPLWSTPINVPSTPIAITGMPNVFVGSNDGKIHELSLATGADLKQVTANTGQPGFVGDPSLDLTLSRIYVSTTDQRAYAFTFPF